MRLVAGYRVKTLRRKAITYSHGETPAGGEDIMSNGISAQKPELLAPAGDFERLQMAIAYGADAVYIGGKQLGLRANAKNFDDSELAAAIEYAHAHNVKVYVTVNIFAKNADFAHAEAYLHYLKQIGADAVIVADPGIFSIARQVPGLEIHISTQANVTNYQSVDFYKQLGASRVVLARELSIEEIAEINKKSAPFQTEVFVHGAMCVSFSGRCLLSNYMNGRDANRGACSQPCRWSYALGGRPLRDNVCEASACVSRPGSDGEAMVLTELKRPDLQYEMYEDERGTYIMNSKDMCMVQHIPQLINSGVASFKIEGRQKSAYYVAVATRAYRVAIDDYYSSPALYESRKDYYLTELKKSSNREFFTGFYFGEPSTIQAQKLDTAAYTSTHDFVGVVQAYNPETRMATVEQRNKFILGDKIEIMASQDFTQTVEEMYDAGGIPINSAPHPLQIIQVKMQQPVQKFDILRKEIPRQ